MPVVRSSSLILIPPSFLTSLPFFQTFRMSTQPPRSIPSSLSVFLGRRLDDIQPHHLNNNNEKGPLLI